MRALDRPALGSGAPPVWHECRKHGWRKEAGKWKNIGPYGYTHRKRDSRLVETARLVRAFCETQEPISYDGEFWRLRDVVVELPPYDGAPPTLWLAGGGPKVLEAIGRWADGWLVYTPGGTLGRPGAIAERLRTIRQHAERAGRDPASITCGLLPCSSVTPTATRCAPGSIIRSCNGTR